MGCPIQARCWLEWASREQSAGAKASGVFLWQEPVATENPRRRHHSFMRPISTGYTHKFLT